MHQYRVVFQQKLPGSTGWQQGTTQVTASSKQDAERIVITQNINPVRIVSCTQVS